MITASGDDIETIRASDLFDAEWYLETYPDVAALGMDPAEHYLWLGARLKRDPSPEFSTAEYLARNGVAVSLNPLLHHLRKDSESARGTRSPVGGKGTDAATAAMRSFPGHLQRTTAARTILVVAHIVGDHLFGSERSFLDILEGLAGIEANVVAVLPQHVEAYTEEVRRRSCETVVFSYGWWRSGNSPSPESVRTFETIIRERQIDAVHVNTIMLREPLIAASNAGAASIVHARELIREDRWLAETIGQSPDRIIEETLARTDFVIANSQATAEAFGTNGRTFVVPNTIDLDGMDIPNPLDGPKVTFGLISSNVPKKGLDDVVELAQACAAVRDARFLIIGPETDIVRRLRERQARGDLPASLEFAGYAASPQAAIEQVNVVLSLSHFAESFGRTALEAMAARRPVIAYRWGALPELVEDGVTGYLVPHLQPRLAAPIVRMLCADRSRISELGEAARKVAEERFSKLQYARRLKTAYDAVFASSELAEAAPRSDARGERVIARTTTEIPPPAHVKPARALPQPVAQAPGRAPVRIAYFCWHFPVPSETFVLNELRYLVQQGHDVVVFCRQSPHPDFRPDFDIQWKRVSSPEELASELTATKRTVAHAHFVYPTVTDLLWPACELAQIPFTFIAHAQDIFRYANDERNRLCEIVRSPLCLRLFVPSTFHREYAIERGVPPGKIVINPQGLDTQLFSGAAIPDRTERRFKAICAVHRFCEKKGLEHLIRAGGDLARDGIRIDLYGYGPLEEQYRAIIADMGLVNVNLCGPVKGREHLIEVLKDYDLFACPSVRAEDGDMDGVPTAIMEAMAAGLPVLTTAISGIPDLVTDGITGIVCEAAPGPIAEAARRYYAMPSGQVEAIIDLARRRVTEKHDIRRLTRVLLRVWERKTIDIVIVSWTHVEEHREVLRRIHEYTSLPFHLIVSINSDDPDAAEVLETCHAENDNVTLVYNGCNTFVGPGTNRALEAGGSDVGIYVCGREGFALQPGWELEYVHHMDENPEVGLAGTLCYAPSYLTGADYPGGIALFSRFRNQSFAADNPQRVFRHVQGGLFAVRRAMYDDIGGFSDAVPHDYTDVEYSYYAESCGWQLGEVDTSVSLYNKTLPGLAARVDETIAAVHPAKLEDLADLDGIARGKRHCCNLCGWHGEAFRQAPDGQADCPQCGATRADRTLYRWLTPSIYLFRRLPAVAVGLSGKMETVWAAQFQGSRLSRVDFGTMLGAGDRLPHGDGGLHLGVLRGGLTAGAATQAALGELARVLGPGGVLLVQGGDHANAGKMAAENGFLPGADVRYGSHAVQFDWAPLRVWIRATTTPTPR